MYFMNPLFNVRSPNPHIDVRQNVKAPINYLRVSNFSISAVTISSTKLWYQVKTWKNSERDFSAETHH